MNLKEKEEEIPQPRDLTYKLLGIRPDRYSRKVATDSLHKEFQLSIEEQLEVLGPKLPEDVAQAAEALPTKLTDRDTRTEFQAERFDNLVEHVKRTNHPLGSAEASPLNSDIEERATELLALDYEILHVQLTVDNSLKKLQDLARMRITKQKELDTRQFWMSSARLLPLDIIMKIISCAANKHLQSKSSLLKLSHVCSSWRRAAQACSSLWNYLALDLWSPTSGLSGDKIDITTLFSSWFGRANTNFPLTVSATITTELNSEAVDDVCTAFRAWGSRIGNLTLTTRQSKDDYDVYGLKVLKPFFEIQGDSFSQLEELCLIDYTRTYEDTDLPTITVFDKSPLTWVIARLPPPLFNGNMRLILPWSRLRTLIIGAKIELEGFINLLFECRNLTTVVFYAVHMVNRRHGLPPLPVPDIPVTFSNLKLFHVCFLGGDIWDPLVLNRLLPTIHLPALQDLRLLGDWDLHHFDQRLSVTSLSTFSSKEYPPLRHLMLVSTNIDLNDLLDILRACPSLEKLSLFLDLPPTLLLESLTSQPTSPRLCHLKMFAFVFNALTADVNPEVDNIAIKFAHLIASWLNDPERDQKLFFKYMFGMYDDSIRYGTGKELDDTEKRVLNLITGVVGENAVETILSVHVIETPDHLIQLFDIEDITSEEAFPPFQE
ncbi:hypothetical protein H0H93_003617 [Arthromyces matolae]|nr:hypothetical protein H0H93_003617 [Arthromyces matolae]